MLLLIRQKTREVLYNNVKVTVTKEKQLHINQRYPASATHILPNFFKYYVKLTLLRNSGVFFIYLSATNIS